jgi:MFS family permease
VFFRSEGYPEMTVASLASCMGFALLAGKILCGQVYDRLGGRLGNFYTFGLLFVGHVLFLLAPGHAGWLAFLAVGIYGMGIPIFSVSTARWAADLNSRDGYASAVRSVNLFSALGSLVFGPLPGTLADRFGGSYKPSYILFGLMLILSLALLHTVYVRLSAGKRP